MKKVMVLFIAMFFVASVVSAQMAEVKVGKGDLTIGTILQAGMDYSLAEDTLSTNGQFTLNRTRVLLSGSICPDRVKFFVQTEFVGGATVLDYKMILLNYIPKTSICIGRFLPNFTYYMPMHTGRLDMIKYPLFVSNPEHANVDFAMWRQAGVQTTTKIEANSGVMMFNLGVFNGADLNNSGIKPFADNNDAFDVLLRVDYKHPLDSGHLRFAGYAWLGNLLLKTSEAQGVDAEDKALNMFGFFGQFMNEKVTFNGEFALRSLEDGFTPSGTPKPTVEPEALKTMGYYAHAEYRINEKWGILGRYDFHDPNTSSDEMAEDDAWTWITVGLNHYIDSWNAMIYLNYIHKMEQNDWGIEDEDFKYLLKNDEILLQFQVAQ